ncbi:LOW QUALITY PROTEIN: uncharacterized protein LOC135095917, partial [Scylla paramamosain]|uniref:LOW QUALITY PROTEIN: uncharacterized protein LOC135095917 n=1 Tax=Scylla paramamosain TaxID=85552 RepID=UPI003083ED48
KCYRTPTPHAHSAHHAHARCSGGRGRGRAGGQGVEGAEASVRARRKLENADSSYDSDFDPSDRGEDAEHGDVYRTVSDTLGAEFAEYVTKYSPSTPPAAPPVTSTTYTPPKPSALPPTTTTTCTTTSVSPVSTTTASLTTTSPTTTTTTTSTPATSSSATTTTKDTTTLPAVSLTQPSTLPSTTTTTSGDASTGATTTTTTITTTSTSDGAGSHRVTCTTTTTTTTTPTTTDAAKPTYASQVEFGIKLGYSESLVQIALTKLGATPNINDLLAELIRLGTTLPKTEGGGGGEEDREDLGVSKEENIPSQLSDSQLQQQQQQLLQPPSLRPVIIDGSNVAMSHGNKTTFSCRGLRVCVDWFRARGHSEITVFVPAWRKEAPRWDTPIADQDLLLDLERERVLVFTPSRVCGGKRIVSYDDRYILNEAVQSGGVVVSNDNYRDLVAESPGFRKVVEESLLMYSWVNGRFVPPDDPLGRSGPTLDVFLRRSARDKDKQAPCPYGRKCTYGNKCKYKHPERGTAPLKSVTEQLQEQAQRHYQSKGQSRDPSPGEGLRGSLSLPVCVGGGRGRQEAAAAHPLHRAHGVPHAALRPHPGDPHPDHSPTTTATPASTAPPHHHLMPPSLDPHRSATHYKSDPALYRLYPSQTHNPYGSSWGWDGSQSSQGSPYSSHLPLSKQQSDPDPQDNPHRKLQRQLTLNPSYDSRLYKIYGFREPAPEHFPLGASTPSPAPTQGQQGSPSRVGRGEGAVFPQGQGRASPGYSSTPYWAGWRPRGATRPPGPRCLPGWGQTPSFPAPPPVPLLLTPTCHPLCLCPGPHLGWPPPAGHRRRCCTTTHQAPQLHLRHTPQPVRQRVALLPRPVRGLPGASPHLRSCGPPTWPLPCPRPCGVPAHVPTGCNAAPLAQRVPAGVTHRLPALPRLLPAPFPRRGTKTPACVCSTTCRSCSLRPRCAASMALHPEETDPQKICGYLLAAAAGAPGTSRPMSPQHQQAAALAPAPPYLLQAFPGGSLAAPPASHEDARLRAFYHLSQLFPEAEVRAVLACAPDETDTQQFCAALLARRAPPQS